jgi:hypothetical protein
MNLESGKNDKDLHEEKHKLYLEMVSTIEEVDLYHWGNLGKFPIIEIFLITLRFYL